MHESLVADRNMVSFLDPNGLAYVAVIAGEESMWEIHDLCCYFDPISNVSFMIVYADYQRLKN